MDGRDATETISQKYSHGTYYFHKEQNAQYEAFCFVGLGFTRKENNVDIATWYNVQTLLLTNLQGTDQAKNSDGYVWSQPYHGGTSMFFVETGDPVFFGIIATSDAGASCWVFCSTNNNTTCQTPVFLHVMDAKVY